MESIVTACCVVLKDTVCKNQKPVLIENIRYPQFECAVQSKRAKSLCARMNKFYKTLAKQFSEYVHSNLAKKAMRKADLLTKPYGAVMNYCVCFDDGENISIVVDVSIFDGFNFSSGRASHNWNLSKCALMPVSFYLDKRRKSRVYIKNLAFEILKENMQNPSFSYFSDCKKQFARCFNVNNFYFVPNGLAFFIDAGLISDVKNGPSVFVIGFDKADGVLKVMPTMQIRTENAKI